MVKKYVPTLVEIERRNRIKVSLWAYAYEILHDPMVSDGTYDKQCLEINLSIDTGHEELDWFFETEFNPDSGQWILSHPELDKLVALYNRLHNEYNEVPIVWTTLMKKETKKKTISV